MKKKVVLLILSCIILAGCTDNLQGEIQNTNEETPVVETETNTEQNTEQVTEQPKEIKPLTMEAVIKLAEKGSALTLEDFAPYLDLIPFKMHGSLQENLEFEYEGEPMCLRISASNKGMINAPYKESLDGATVFHAAFLELDTMEKEYAYDKGVGDIRSGNLQNILDGTVTMDDYVTVELPEEISESSYKFWMGSRGGVTFLREGEMDEELAYANTGLHGEVQSAGGIEIWGVGEIYQSMEILETFESLEQGELLLKRELLRSDTGNTWYVAYPEKEGSCISYYFYLNGNEFSQEDFLAATESMRFKEGAIY